MFRNAGSQVAFCLTMTGKFIYHVCDQFFCIFDKKLPTVFVSNITLMGDKVHDCFKVNGKVDDGSDNNDTADDGMAGDDAMTIKKSSIQILNTRSKKKAEELFLFLQYFTFKRV